MTKEEPKYFNRELSWLEFNQRVLDEARDESVPVLDRLKFLAITASNLDEFFMIRVGGLQTLAARGSQKPDPSGLTPAVQLDAISKRTHQMTVDQYACYLGELEPALAAGGIQRVGPRDVNEQQLRILEQVFEDEIFSILTPMAVSSTDDFPILTNCSLNVCVQLKPAAGDETQSPRFAVIPIGRSVRRFITVPAEGRHALILLEDAVAIFIARFFPGEEIVETVPFRITRNADLSIREDLASDLLAEIEEVLDARKQSDCVRLELSDHVTTSTRLFLQSAVDVADRDVYALPGPLELSAFMQVTEIAGFDALRYEDWPPRPSPLVDPRASMFEVISRQDVLLYHPYESFEPVVRLLEEAADDDDVLAIKQTLYRTSRTSAIVAALKRAALEGKYVTVVVELKARFDEARNIAWARELEHAGVQVIYGVKNFKTHAKLCIIVRREPTGIVRYVHFGTGNYNESTARLYSDASYMTANPDLGADATSFFNAITGYSQPQHFRKIEAAPIGLREKILEMINNEIERRRQGQNASIIAKVNSLVDTKVIDALYAASQEGVNIQLNVRGICCLRPGVKGLSENIRVVSIVDRFLEHSRIFYFHHGGDERLFISSADWMERNFDRRLELLVPVEDVASRNRLIEILECYFRDTVKGRRLRTDGSYARPKVRKGAQPFRSQQELYERAREVIRQMDSAKPTVFEPHRATGTGP